MVVISTSYDPATAILDACAADFVTQAGSRVLALLGPAKSDAHQIQQCLKEKSKVAFFFFGHGKLEPKGLFSQNRVPAIHDNNQDLLQGRFICATACYSLQILELAAKQYSATVLGYVGVLRLPILPEYHKRFRQCVLTAHVRLLAGESAQKACQATALQFEKEAQNLIGGSVADNVMASAIFRPAAQNIRFSGPDRTL